jgi:hypothetical protein
MTLALGVVLVLAAIAFVLMPLFRPSQHPAISAVEPLHARAALYQEILDAELDYHLGKLSEGDFVEVRDRLLEQAVLLIHADPNLDATAATQQIEAEIEAARAALGGPRLADRLGA